MNTLRKTYFISDLHLEEKRPEITQQFFKLLAGCEKEIDAIYILGDLFELWLGDDDETTFNRSIIEALRKTVDKGIPIYFIFGNRDFLIGKKFLQQSGCKLLADEAKINLYGTPVLLMHGDTLCTLDLAYQKSRRIFTNPLIRTLILLLPLQIRRHYGNKMRRASKQHTRQLPPEIMDVTETAVQEVMQKHNVNYLIHGHTHQPAMHVFNLNNKEMLRIVLAAWHEEGSVLIWDERGNKQMVGLSKL